MPKPDHRLLKSFKLILTRELARLKRRTRRRHAAKNSERCLLEILDKLRAQCARPEIIAVRKRILF